MSQSSTSSHAGQRSSRAVSSLLFIEGNQGIAPYRAGAAQRLQGALRQISPIGGGSFGDVWHEEWTRPDGQVTQVAVKYLRNVRMRSTPNAEDERAMKRLQREKFVWQRLRHQNVLPLLAYMDGNAPALISPYCPNGNIPSYMKRTQLRFIHKLRLVTETASGMKYLHSLNPPVCHGDLKPENVLVNKNQQACINDLGLSQAYRETNSGWTTSGISQGTPYYRSYELLFHNEQTVPGDVYAFASLVLAVLSGIPPFYKASETVLAQATEDEIMPNQNNHPGLPASSPIWSLLFQCWAKSQEARPTMAQVCTFLENHLTQRAQAGQFDA